MHTVLEIVKNFILLILDKLNIHILTGQFTIYDLNYTCFVSSIHISTYCIFISLISLIDFMLLHFLLFDVE